MTTAQPKPVKRTTSTAKTQQAATDKPAANKAALKKPAVASAKTAAVKSGEFPVHNQIAPFSVKKKKQDKAKVIRDSFSFPVQDHHKITELKKICLAAGVHVKKGEILRAGLNLLTDLNLAELLLEVEKIERVKTGRPKSVKKLH
jgi:flagellar basal body-associated protein FliL